jgi:hypothetical protein
LVFRLISTIELGAHLGVGELVQNGGGHINELLVHHTVNVGHAVLIDQDSGKPLEDVALMEEVCIHLEKKL